MGLNLKVASMNAVINGIEKTVKILVIDDDGGGGGGQPISISYNGTTATIENLASLNIAYTDSTATIGG